MSETRKLKVVIGGDSKGAQAAVSGLSQKTKGLGRDADAGNSKWAAFTRRIGAIGLAAAGGLGVAGAGAVAFGIKTAASFEQTEMSFSTLLKSNDRAKREMAWLKEKAAATPFELGDLANADRTLLGFGMKVDKVRQSFLLNMGDMAAAVGMPSSRLPDLARIFGQVHAAGTVSMEDINQLIDAGIPIWDMLTTATGKNVKVLRKEIESRKLSADTFESAAQTYTKANFAGAMEKQSKTLNGLWSSLKDNLALAAAEMVQPLMPLIKDLMPKLADWAKRAGEIFVNDVIPAIKGVIAGLKEFGGWIQRNRGWLEPLAAAIVAVAVAVGVYKGVVMAVSAVTRAWTAIQAAFNVVMMMNPIGLVILAIVALAAVIFVLWKRNEGFRKVVLKVWNAIKGAVVPIAQWIAKYVVLYFKTMWNLATRIFGFLKSAIVNSFNAYRKTVGAVMNWIVGRWRSGWNTVRSAVQHVVNAVRAVVGGLRSTIQQRIHQVVSIVTGLRSRIMGFFSGAGSWLWNAGTNIIRGLINGVSSMIGKLRDKFSSITNLIPDWKGPADRDRKLLAPAGRLVMRGFVDGVDFETPRVKGTLGRLTADLAGTATRSAQGSLATASLAAAPGTTTVVNVHVAGTVTSERRLVDALKIPLRDAIARTGKRNGSTGL